MAKLKLSESRNLMRVGSHSHIRGLVWTLLRSPTSSRRAWLAKSPPARPPASSSR
ncbi:ruvB-like 2 isoform X1 [Sesbania bispinosa]|nr:ruvB-like 2 isoform X1 [Sesbania bispinosa]